MFWAGILFDKIKRYDAECPHLSKNDTHFYGVRGLRLGKLAEFLESKFKSTEKKPEVIFIHCASNDINATASVGDLVHLVSSTLHEIFALSKKHQSFKLVWSDVLFWVHYRSMPRPTGRMFTTNLNAAAHFCCDTEKQGVVMHPTIDPRCFSLYHYNKFCTDPVHLSDTGYKHMFMEFNECLELMHTPD